MQIVETYEEGTKHPTQIFTHNALLYPFFYLYTASIYVNVSIVMQLRVAVAGTINGPAAVERAPHGAAVFLMDTCTTIISYPSSAVTPLLQQVLFDTTETTEFLPSTVKWLAFQNCQYCISQSFSELYLLILRCAFFFLFFFGGVYKALADVFCKLLHFVHKCITLK